MTNARGDPTAELWAPPQQDEPGAVSGETAAVPQPRAVPAAGELVPIRGPESGHGHAVRAGCTTIGRDRGCDIVLNEPTASRQHAELHYDGGDHYILLDTGSLNGIYVNRARTPRAELADGDEIWIGKSRFAFRLPPGTGSSARAGPEHATGTGSHRGLAARDINITLASESNAPGHMAVRAWHRPRA